MPVIVSDTTPLNYLVLIEAVEILPRLYTRVLIPPAVREELITNPIPPSWYALGWPNLLPG